MTINYTVDLPQGTLAGTVEERPLAVFAVIEDITRQTGMTCVAGPARMESPGESWAVGLKAPDSDAVKSCVIHMSPAP